MQKNKKFTKKLYSSSRQGFTLIEISIVLAFVSVLLISIALIISNIMAVYQKGLTLKAVDSVGRNLIDEFTTAINAAPSIDTANLCRSYAKDDIDACQADNAYKYIFQSRQSSIESVQYSGVLCTGNYSYIWNTQYGIQTTSPSQSLDLTYLNSAGEQKTLQRPTLARFEDKNYLACTTSMKDNKYEYKPDFSFAIYPVNITKLANGQDNRIADPETNFLDGSELPLLLYELTIFPISQDSVTLRSFFSGTFILATEQNYKDASILRTDDYCLVQNSGSGILDLGSRFNYCAINKFNFAARTAGV